MKDFLKITAFQSDIIWNSKTSNFVKYEQTIDKLNDLDLLLFPELFDTGFVTDIKLLNPVELNLSKKWLVETSARKNFAIGGTSIVYESGKYVNRFMLSKPDGEFYYYDKKHLFSIAGENNYISGGNKRIVVPFDNWRINLLICYDLRFPVWARYKEDYDVLVYLANWPKSRIEQWKALLIARAIENQAYTIGLNRVGVDAHGFEYPGLSLVIDPKGEIIYQAKENLEDVFSVELDFNYLQKIRQSFPVLKDADKFNIIE